MKKILVSLLSYFQGVNPWAKHWLVIAVRGFMIVILFYLFCIHYLEPHQAAIVWDRVTGKLWLDTKPAWHFTWPWVSAARIDMRPQRVCITSGTKAVNCKLVRFKASAFREFVATEGFRYYWLSNRLSFNWGYDEEYRGWRDILRGYAFSVKKYPFIVVVQEYKE